MKKTISAVLVCVLLLGCVFALTSCAKTLSGTYKRDGLIVDTTYEFKGNEVTIINGMGSLSHTTKATYVIEEKDDGTMTITFTYSEGETPDEDLKGTKSFEEGKKENGDKFIKIGGIEYIKQ